jgi:hypothetical protein
LNANFLKRYEYALDAADFAVVLFMNLLKLKLEEFLENSAMAFNRKIAMNLYTNR